MLAERFPLPGSVDPGNPRTHADSRDQLIATSLIFLLFAGQGFRDLLGWVGYLALAAIALVYVCIRLWSFRRDPRLLRAPIALVLFLAVCGASIIWSNYQWATSLGLLAQWATTLAALLLALLLGWDQLIRALATAMLWILGLSLVFELVVSVVIRDRLAPLWSGIGADAPGPMYWSENHLFEGGPIQGIVGNRNLLGFIALLALVLFAAMAARSSRRLRWQVALALPVVTILLTRSATVVGLALALGALLTVVALLRRLPRHRRRQLLIAVGALAAIAIVLALAFPETALGLLGRTDASGRGEIWRTVLSLAEQRPILGWGWVSYWAPWVYPFNGLVVIQGVEYLQAHNALLDLLLQVGVVGALAGAIAAVAAVTTAWRRALSTTGPALRSPAVVALLLLAALLGQSLTESRLLLEGNWALFAVLAVKLSFDAKASSGRPSVRAVRVEGRGRDGRSVHALASRRWIDRGAIPIPADAPSRVDAGRPSPEHEPVRASGARGRLPA
ncbi:O-antigen ligase family protein [Amnibacterium flavum]|uniref:Exopolysaccharide production protein n=1 Tax=Amnibacterium flavum TaxID=2173173 RepID=A0A2V1HMP3_9MICO|nr:O-antigen ligase family protein [Amnibacterium flavum]PVZ93808.1 exopolysaccharide production protein [Amnibacterium flavum]